MPHDRRCVVEEMRNLLIQTMEREKNNFISMVAHDMKSPLIAIGGLIRRLQKEQV
jgi:signal transduction histidine kinase